MTRPTFAPTPAWAAYLSFLTWLGGDPWGIARFWPGGMAFVYLLLIGLISVTWRGRLLTSSRSASLFCLFFFTFGISGFYLRFNVAPQTLGFALFLFALGLLPLAQQSIAAKATLLLILAAMITAHPVTPLLAAPGLLVVAWQVGDGTLIQV